MTEPDGYWPAVFNEAKAIMNQRPTTEGETAFWMAKATIDKELEHAD
jgi:hypothetical protein